MSLILANSRNSHCQQFAPIDGQSRLESGNSERIHCSFTGRKMSTHTIRLAGPWEHFSVPTEADKAAIRCQLPFLLPSGCTAARLVRAFHRPSRLSAETRVNVLVRSLGVDLTASLNDRALNGVRLEDEPSDTGVIEIHRYSTGGMLADFNRFSLLVARPANTGTGEGDFGVINVSLEIIEPPSDAV